MKLPNLDEIELRPDGWERFERAVDAAVKGGPKPRAVKKLLGKRETDVLAQQPSIERDK